MAADLISHDREGDSGLQSFIRNFLAILEFDAWVRGRVEKARQYFREGKRYLDELDVLRCKIAGY